MVDIRPAPFAEHAHFKPREVHTITGVSASLLRDWRRRKIIHESFDRSRAGFPLDGVATVLVIRALGDHGLDPKGASAWVIPLGEAVTYFALNDPGAWDSAEEHHTWLTTQEPVARFGVLRLGSGAILIDDPRRAFAHWHSEVATVVDLEALGKKLRDRSSKQLARLVRQA